MYEYEVESFIQLLMKNTIGRHYGVPLRPQKGHKIFDPITKKVIGQIGWDEAYGQWSQFILDRDIYAKCRREAARRMRGESPKQVRILKILGKKRTELVKKNVLKIVYFYSDYHYYPLERAFRKALGKIADVTFVRLYARKEGSVPKNALTFVKKYNPDAIVVGIHNFNYKFVKNLDKVNRLKIMLCDDPHHMFEAHIKFMTKNKIDIILVQTGLTQTYKRRLTYKCIVKSWLRPADTKLFKDYGLERKWDVFLTGAIDIYDDFYPLRKIISAVLARQPDIKTNIRYGFQLSSQEYAKQMAQSKICIFGNGRKNYFNTRLTQAMASKTLAMCPKPNGATEYHLTSKNFVEINKGNFLEKLRFYLTHEKEREEIVNNAYKTISKYHTCEIRAKKFVNMIQGNLRPKVAIFMPSFNRPNLIWKSIETVRAQTMIRWKLYILDNSSPQIRSGIRARLNAIAKADSRIKVFFVDKLIHQGTAYNELMFRYSSRDEEYVLFFADDTLMHPRKLEILTNYLDGHPNHNIVCGILRVTGKSKTFGNFNKAKSGYCVVNLVQPLIRRSLINKVGLMKEVNMHHCAPDATYWKQIAATGSKIFGAQAIQTLVPLDVEYGKTYSPVNLNRKLWKDGWKRGELYE